MPVLPEEGQNRKGVRRTGTAFAGKGAKGSLIRTEITVHFVSMMIDLLHAVGSYIQKKERNKKYFLTQAEKKT